MRDHDVTTLRYAADMAKVELGHHFLREWRKKRGLSLRKLADRFLPISTQVSIQPNTMPCWLFGLLRRTKNWLVSERVNPAKTLTKYKWG